MPPGGLLKVFLPAKSAKLEASPSARLGGAVLWCASRPTSAVLR